MIDLDALERRLDVAPYAIFGPELRQVITRLRLAEAALEATDEFVSQCVQMAPGKSCPVCHVDDADFHTHGPLCGWDAWCQALVAWRSAKEGDGG